MRKCGAAAFVMLLVFGADAPSAQMAASSSRAPSPNHPAAAFTVHVRDARDGALTLSVPTNGAGRFPVGSLRAGTYVVEIADVAGRLAGLSPAVPVPAGGVLVVTVGGLAAQLLSAREGGAERLEIGPLASVSIEHGAAAADPIEVQALREGKLFVCHAAGGVRQTLEIREPARHAHLRHGDSLGPCPAPSAP